MFNFLRKSDLSFLAEARRAVPESTPDICVLEQKDSHLVFDYGDLITHVPQVCPAFTVEKLTMWQQNREHGTPPVVMKIHGEPRAKISGNLYLMSTEDLVYLDKHK